MASTSSTTSENLNVDLELDFESEETEIGKVCFCGNELLDDLVNCAGMSCETEWFHVGCSGLTDTDAHTEEWFCENCQEQMYADEHDACEDQTPGQSASRKDDRKQKTTQGNKTKETAPKCPQVYTVQNALDMSVVFILQCLNSFFTDSLYCMDSGLSVELQTLAKQLLENGSVPLKEFSKFIVQQLWDVIYPDNKRPITSSDRGRMWNRFHNLRLDPQVLKVWKELLSRINLLTIALSSAQLFMLQHIWNF
ncbi:hypothetical protein BSL78_28222 [Apostichopus japonicus]|uniref:PHD-type domain-containing protein n=1 Tax=Stichopus japonicus TaxID=307972 RepID=A0A2G8JGQ7_STIJA|nr:hypothetical protein BSL78_28222 [Apostichopus japonicus]